MDWKGRTVLVTGGTGFIGSFLTERLLAAGANVRIPIRSQNFRALSERRAEIDWMEGDLRDSEYCARLVDGVDHVFHLASCRRTVEYHERKSADVCAENVRMTLALIEALKEHPATPVVFFSSANVPQSCDVLALAQQDAIDGYVLGKVIAETLWFMASRQRGFPLLILRPVGVYGPRDTFTKEGNVITALMVKARDADDQLEVWGSGKEERTFLYVEDVVSAVMRLVEAGAEGVQYITTPDVVKIAELAALVRDIVRPDLRIRFDSRRRLAARAVPRLPIHDCLRDFAWTPLRDGMRRTYEEWK